MIYQYKPTGVCSRQFTIEVENDIIISFSAEGGCNGNLKGIGQLVKNRSVEEVVSLLEGIECGKRSTSCPDQLAQALKEYSQKEAQVS